MRQGGRERGGSKKRDRGRSIAREREEERGGRERWGERKMEGDSEIETSFR